MESINKIFTETREKIKGLVKKEQVDEVLEMAIRSLMSDNEKSMFTLDSDLACAWCLQEQCRENFFVIKEYKTKEVICPFCKEKLKVRCFKNGRIDVYKVTKGKLK